MALLAKKKHHGSVDGGEYRGQQEAQDPQHDAHQTNRGGQNPARHSRPCRTVPRRGQPGSIPQPLRIRVSDDTADRGDEERDEIEQGEYPNMGLMTESSTATAEATRAGAYPMDNNLQQ